ncbi:hypothetical protein [Aeromonas caviae]|uniref:hypothetical protein n=1 Tax=Aeromonas caviae TaxID=648 RepID=UPI001CC7ACF7|nr:hypothetical protein [Aeromonas caviae]GJA84666.1 hypothetical protein KAM356_07250 [Aeromonas caviae]GJA88700.1 hypothetical protein KAM357_06480 [Aeromonas caviae]GJB06012.1 hypothetical protein KAM361_06850 [Aeromonas caviae]GJB14498.1 hypothetical protein KAM363_05030 [Aeromonas caviae]GJB30275.1 hypothetical protein KAM366_34720 [Aeromonas caviae]
MTNQLGISEDQLANNGDCIMTRRLFSRAAKRADQIVAAIADRLNGNAARRRAIKQRLHLAMMQTEQHRIVAARAAQRRTTGFTKHSALLHWRIQFHRKAI